MNAPLPAQWTPSPGYQEEKLAAHRLGKDFVKAILTHPFEELPNLEPTEDASPRAGDDSGEMRLWRNIPNLESGRAPMNIVLRSNVEPFWQNCINKVENTDPGNARFAVCAIGTPGIGKTYTTPLLLRMLLLKGSTVVYIRHSVKRDSWYYEFIPRQSTNNESGGGWDAVTVNVYPEKHTMFYDIPSLKVESTYYVVDPGETKESCDPGAKFKPRVIIVASPDERHWGGGEFQKLRGNKTGVFRYYPLWSYSEVLRGLPHFSPPVRLTEEQLAERYQQLPGRYREVGGVPRNLIKEEDEYKKILKTKEKAIGAVTLDHAQMIMSGNMDSVGLFDNDSPKSAVIGIALADNDNGRFTEEKPIPVSTFVAEEVFKRHIQGLWQDMVRKERPLVFESYLRTVLTKRGYEIEVHNLDEKGSRTEERPNKGKPRKIGGYSGIRIVPVGESIVTAAIKYRTANILFYSANPNYKLIDFACRDKSGRILAFQATTSKRHEADVNEIKILEKEVGTRGLMLYYLHPHSPDVFRTTPPTPETQFCWIFHVAIPKPTEASPSQSET